MAEYPDNAWTRMIQRASAMNAEGGGRASIGMSGPLPSVQSASVGRESIELPPLTPQEKEVLDAKARELGLLPPLPGEGLGQYDTYEAALAAAGAGSVDEDAPTVDPVEAMAHAARQARQQRVNPEAFAKEVLRVETRTEIVEVPRLPDFTKVQGMDLQKGVAYLDSMEFEVPAEHLRRLRKFVVELARLTFTERLEAATRLFSEVEDEEMPEVSGDETA